MIRFGAIAFTLATAVAPAAVSAQSAEAWRYQASIYAYLPTLSGSTTFPPASGGSGASVDIDTILDNLKMTFMGSFEAKRGQWGVFTDVIYMDIGDSKSGSRDLSIGGVTLPAGVNANVDFDLKGWAWTLGGAFQAVKTPDAYLDVIGGLRMLDIEQSLDWTLTGNVGAVALPNRTGSRGVGLQNWDFIVGVKGRVAFGEGRRWYAPYYLDAGFGDSDATWQALAGIGYSFDWGDLFASWRYLDYDMKSGKAISSLTFNGPTIGAVFRW
ncbi:MAG: hypothetical protein U5L03_08895 [Burkholderiaceae bacterium]|nr:hypothetical protein [Burkholderiaceae bacterium]